MPGLPRPRRYSRPIAEALKQEVATYSDYFCGNAYGKIVEQDGEEVDACWGFIGNYDGFCLEEVRRVV
tara:strand:+ start:11485 stop:11688 length:204 start_codon:yes stop_codon:yes gene_type:complete